MGGAGTLSGAKMKEYLRYPVKKLGSLIKQGFPIGVQIITNPWQDDLVLALGKLCLPLNIN